MQEDVSLSTFRRLSSISLFRAKISPKVSVKVTIWDQIISEYEDNRKTYYDNRPALSPVELIQNDNVEYLRKEVLPQLYIALDDTLLKAKQWDCLLWQKCYYSGLDNIAEILWNLNPRYPERKQNWKTKFEMPWVIDLLEQSKREIYPLSWLWSREYAALIIQKCYRAYKDICNKPDILEMRRFWKELAQDNIKDEEIRLKIKKERDILSEKQERAIARQELMQYIELSRIARINARKAKEKAEEDLKKVKRIEMNCASIERRKRREEFAIAREQRDKNIALLKHPSKKSTKIEKVSSDISTCG